MRSGSLDCPSSPERGGAGRSRDEWRRIEKWTERNERWVKGISSIPSKA